MAACWFTSDTGAYPSSPAVVLLPVPEALALALADAEPEPEPEPLLFSEVTWPGRSSPLPQAVPATRPASTRARTIDRVFVVPNIVT
jgi:hypothetical protein